MCKDLISELKNVTVLPEKENVSANSEQDSTQMEQEHVTMENENEIVTESTLQAEATDDFTTLTYPETTLADSTTELKNVTVLPEKENVSANSEQDSTQMEPKHVTMENENEIVTESTLQAEATDDFTTLTYPETTLADSTTGLPMLLFSNRGNIKIVDAYNVSRFVIEVEDAVALDFLFDDSYLFWIDVSLKTVKRSLVIGSQVTEDIVTTNLISPEGIATDWIGKKLYLVDSETHRIEVCNIDGSHRKVLIWTNLDRPRAIVVDSLDGYMYWTDWGEHPKIERSWMDGNSQSRTLIVHDNIEWPNGLSLDHDDSRIYWVDARLHYIHSCDFDGRNRRVVVEGNLPSPYALSVFGPKVYWTDQITNSINSCNKITGGNRQVIHSNIQSLMDIHVYSSLRQPKGLKRNPCENDNGGCSHLCLITPSEPFYTCACPTGIKLLNDSQNCANGSTEMLFVVRRRDIRRISLDTPDFTAVVLPVRNISHGIAIDYDPLERHIYWTDDEIKKIRRANIDGTGQKDIISSQIDYPDGIAVDWIGRNLYWTDTGTDQISVARLNGSFRKVLIPDDLDEPRAICLDPVFGLMYWTDWGKMPRIEKANMDGSKRIIVVDTSLGWPNGLAIDHMERKLYWGDAKKDKIESMNMDGTGRVTVLRGIAHIFGFGLLGNYVYWTEWQSRSISRVSKNGNNRETIVDQLPDLMGMVAVNLHGAGGTNACADENFGCSHLCLMRSGSVPRCACSDDLILDTDGKSCFAANTVLLFSSGKGIKKRLFNNNSREDSLVMKGVMNASNMDFDNYNRIYWTDWQSKSINRAFMNGSYVEQIIKYDLKNPKDITVDWIADNIYWIDSGTKGIEMARIDGSSRKVLIWKDIQNLKSFAMDPLKGYMYWTAGEEFHTLERAYLDGTFRKVLIPNIGVVNALAIDYSDNRLYWGDLNTNSIKSADMNGNDIKTIVNNVPQPMDIILYEDHVLWSDWTKYTIEQAEKISGTNRTVLVKKNEPIKDILVYFKRHTGVTGCYNNNGGCSNLCLALPLEDQSNHSFRCACPTHYQLNIDNRTCSVNSFLLFSQRREIKSLMVDSNENASYSVDVSLPIPGLKNIKSLDFDPVDRKVYWIEGKLWTVKSAYENGTLVSTVVDNVNNMLRPFDIAIDPYTRSLFWTCAKTNLINITRLDYASVGAVIQDDRQKPRFIAVDPVNGRMYWTNMFKGPTIEYAAMDGTNKIVLFNTRFIRPGPLTIDNKEGKLYFADSRLQRIEYCDLTGRNRRILVQGQIKQIKGMAVLGDFIYWVDKGQNSIEKADKKDGKDRKLIQIELPGLSDLCIAENSLLLERSQHPCGTNNGGCSHICIPYGDGTARCSCPVPLVLRDGNCIDRPLCTSGQFTCISGGTFCIPLVWRCDGLSECEDSSDEENCPVLQCDWPGQLDNGNIIGDATTIGSVLFFSCNPRTTFEGETFEITCLQNGQWSGPLPTCWGQCDVSSLEHVILEEGNQGRWINHRQAVSYKCRDDPEILQTAICNNGTWENLTMCSPDLNQHQCSYKLYPNTSVNVGEMDISHAPSTLEYCLESCSEYEPTSGRCGGVLFRDGYKCTELSSYDDFTTTTPATETMFYRRVCEGCNRVFDYQCGSGECLHFRQVCDYVVDCSDSSDESNCGEHVSLSDDYRGTVAIVRNNMRFTICDDPYIIWDVLDATVMCKLAGYSDGIPLASIRLEEPTLWVRSVNCMGSEESLDQCEINRSPICHGNRAVQVECSPTFPPPS